VVIVTIVSAPTIGNGDTIAKTLTTGITPPRVVTIGMILAFQNFDTFDIIDTSVTTGIILLCRFARYHIGDYSTIEVDFAQGDGCIG